jgi:hypothetical protein
MAWAVGGAAVVVFGVALKIAVMQGGPSYWNYSALALMVGGIVIQLVAWGARKDD